jgi:hypothetical protein
MTLWFRRQKVAGIFVLRIGEDFLGRTGLNNLALGHDADAVSDFANDAEVMRDEQHRHAVLFLQSGQKLEDLRLHGHIERRGRLIGDQQLRFIGKRHRDHDALSLATGQLVRIGPEALFRIANAYLAQEFKRPRPRGTFAHPAMDLQDLANLLLDRMQRVKRGHWLLEDHGDLVATNLAQRLLVLGENVLAMKKDLARRMACSGIGQQLQHGQRGDGLA